MIETNQYILTTLYYIFCGTAITSALMVIISANAMHSVLFLILVFCNISALFIILGAEFLALLFLIVYVGAIAVLFLFVVMMLQTNVEQTKKQDFTQYLLIGFFFLCILTSEIFLTIFGTTFITETKNNTQEQIWLNILESKTNLEVIGQLLYDEFIIEFLLAGIILFLSMVGAILLTQNKRGEIKRQDIYKQIARTSNETIKIWKTK